MDALRAAGCLVLSLAGLGKGVPDLLVGTPQGDLVLIEVKDGAKPPSARRLTEDQERWHQTWRRVRLITVISPRDALEKLELTER